VSSSRLPLFGEGDPGNGAVLKEGKCVAATTIKEIEEMIKKYHAKSLREVAEGSRIGPYRMCSGDLF